MENFKKNIILAVNPALEFLHSLDFIANKKTRYRDFAELYFAPSDEFKTIVEEIYNKLSSYIHNEMHFFFEWEPMKITLLKIIQSNPHIDCTKEFISIVEHLDETSLTTDLIKYSIYGSNMDSIGDLKNINDLSSIINSADEDVPYKEKLIECANNPYEIKTRLVLLLKQFYENAYKEYEDRILSTLWEAKEKYELILNEDYNRFDKEFLSFLPKENYKKLVIHISYFIQVRVSKYDYRYDVNTEWISLGIYSENYPRKKFVEAKAQNFIKILSDKNRFQIIKLLGEKPCYVSELAVELKLTSPTVCYHLNYLREFNIVSIKRVNSKTYYILNKEEIISSMNYSKLILLNEYE